MKVQKFVISFLILLSVCQICFGQKDEFERNWYKDTKGIDNPWSGYEFGKRYTEKDVDEAINKYHLIKSHSPKNNEWEGFYTSDSMLGYEEIYWNKDGGFVRSYYYHRLLTLDYGFVKDENNSIKLYSQKSSTSKDENKLITHFIKIKYGNRHYLVPENLIKKFAETAVGLTNDESEDKFYYYKVDDEKKNLFGIPILPSEYERFQRFPVEAQIIKVKKSELKQNKFEDGTVYSEYYDYEVILNVGRNKNIKQDLIFFVKDLNEWIGITKVYSKKSKGIITRYVNKNREELCDENVDISSENTNCLKIKIGLTAKTENRHF